MIDPITADNTMASKIAATSQTQPMPPLQPAAAPAAKTETATPSTMKADTIQLSNAAQALILRQKGLSIAEIALRLRLDIGTVNGFFPQSSSHGPPQTA